MFEQDRVIVRLQQRVLQDAAILACFLAGSYGRRVDDGYSDLDIGLVFADEAKRDTAWQNRREFVQSVMPYVPCRSFDGVHVRPYFHITLYNNGCKADYRYETPENLRPNPWDRDIRLLKDTGDWGKQFQEACASTLFTQPRITTEELNALDERFWVMFWDVYRLVLRGDFDKPFTIYLELLHFALPPLLTVLPPEDPAHKGLLNATYSHDTKATAKGMAKLLEAYLAARTAVIRRLSLAFMPNTSFESGIQKLVQKNA